MSARIRPSPPFIGGTSSVISNNDIIIDGLDGSELLADAQDAGSATPLKVYQVILFDGRSYILMQGVVGAKVADEFLPEFKKMARSLSRHLQSSPCTWAAPSVVPSPPPAALTATRPHPQVGTRAVLHGVVEERACKRRPTIIAG
jgi:hypothetical protein